MTKENILDNIIPDASDNFDANYRDDVLTAMASFAKYEAISFKEWQDENLEDRTWGNYDGHDTWINPHTMQVISTEQLYDIFLKQKRK